MQLFQQRVLIVVVVSRLLQSVENQRIQNIFWKQMIAISHLTQGHLLDIFNN